MGLFKKSPKAIFSVKVTQDLPLQHQDGRKKNKRKKIFSKSNSNQRGSGLVLQTKITYDGVLNRPKFTSKKLL